MMIAVVIILLLLLIGSVVAGVWATSRLTTLVYDLEDQVEESLDIIDSCHREIGRVLDTPVFFDDPVVKQTLTSIKKSHKALLLVANKISEFSGSKKEEEEETPRYM